MISNNIQGGNDEPLFKKINRLRKSGSLNEAWNIGVEAVQQNPQDGYLKGAFFWVCYDYLKSIQAPIVERGKAEKKFFPQPEELQRINQYLDWVQWLNLPITGFEYPRLLALFKPNAEFFPQLIDLVLTHQLAVFDDEAKTPYVTDNGEVPSLLLSYARKLAQLWLASDNKGSLNLEVFLAFMNSARLACKDTQHLMWLDYDQAKCLVIAKRYEEARELVIPLLKKKQRESWAWAALASTYSESDVDAAICLFAHAINCSHEDSFALPSLRWLAKLLNSKGFNDEASMCVKRAVACYENKGWKVKDNIQSLLSQPWFNQSADVGELASRLKNFAANANNYLHGKTITRVGLVVAIHQSNKGFNIYFGRNDTSSSPMFAVKGKKPKAGDYIQIETAEGDPSNSIISAAVCSPMEIEGVAVFTGELRVTEKGFGFVDDVFIPPFLISEGMATATVEVLCYLDLDKKKGVLGKKAATVKIANMA